MAERLGRYLLDRRIALGGMAEVFMARQSGPEGYVRPCVVKRMLPNLSTDPVFVRMFLDEARLAAQLSHPNIAVIYDFGADQDMYYLAMEYVPGANLRDLVEKWEPRKRHPGNAQVARIVAQVALALDYAHNALSVDGKPLNVIHRDVSTHNVMLSNTGAVKLIDFGIAKASTASQQTAAGIIKGKFAYMSPEQIRGAPLDLRTDIYSLGLVLFELLTNEQALNGVNGPSLMEAAYYGRVLPIDRFRPDLPPALKRVLDRALAKDREQRYTSAAEMSAELERFVSANPAGAGTDGLARLLVDPPVSSPNRPLLGDPLPPTEAVRQKPPSKWEVPTLPPDAPTVNDLPVPTTQATKSYRLPSADPASQKVVPVAPPAEAPEPAWAPGSRWPVWAVAALALAGAAVFGVVRWRGPAGGGVPGARRTVAVLGFEDGLGRQDLAWVPTALSEMLGMELAAGGELRLITSDEAARAERELTVNDFDALLPQTVQRLGKNLGADYLIAGDLRLPEDAPEGGAPQFRAALKLWTAADGRLVRALEDTANSNELPQLAARLAQSARVQLDVGDPDRDGGKHPRAVLSRNPQAARDHATGLAALHRLDLVHAREALEKAVVEDPTDARAFASLSGVFYLLGDEQHAREALQHAEAHADGLSPEEAKAVRGRAAELSHDWQKAMQTFGELADRYPDRLDYCIYLAHVTRNSGAAQKALDVLDACAKRPSGPPDGSVNIERSRNLKEGLNDFHGAVAAADAAANEARTAGNITQLARALQARAAAQIELGEMAKALADYDEAQGLCNAVGDRSCAAGCLAVSGGVLSRLGDLPGARQRLEQAIAVGKEVNANAVLLNALGNLGAVDVSLGELRAARVNMEASLDKAREMGFAPAVAQTLLNLASVDVELGDPRAAQELQEAHDALDKVGAAPLVAVASATMGSLAIEHGELAAGRKTLEAALPALKKSGRRASLATVEEDLAAVLFEQDHRDQARPYVEDARGLTEEADKVSLAALQVQLATLDEEEHLSDAAPRVWQAAQTLRDLRAHTQEVRAVTRLAALLRRQGDTPGARQAIAQAQPVATENAWDALALAIESAADASSPATLETLAKQADAKGWPRLALEAGRDRAEVELSQGKTGAAHATAAAVAKRATALGYARLARQVQALRR